MENRGGGKIPHDSISYGRMPDCIFLHIYGKINHCRDEILEVGWSKENKGKWIFMVDIS